MKTDQCHPWPETRSSVLQGVHDLENQAAWKRYYDLYAPYIYRLARFSGLQRADANEIVQVVILETGQNITRGLYDPAKGRFRAWLRVCTNNKITDMHRRQTRLKNREKQGVDLSDEQTEWILRQTDLNENEFEDFAEKEWRELVAKLALEKLREQIPDKQFSIFHAYAIEEWPVEKVAKVFSVSRDVVYQTKTRLTPLYSAAAKEAARDLDSPPLPS